METASLSGRTLPRWLLLVGLALAASPLTAAAEPHPAMIAAASGEAKLSSAGSQVSAPHARSVAGGSPESEGDHPASAQPASIQVAQQLDSTPPVKPSRPIVVPPGMFAILAEELEKDIAETNLELPSADARTEIPRPTTPNVRLVSRTDTVVGVAPTPLPDTGPGCPRPPPCKCHK